MKPTKKIAFLLFLNMQLFTSCTNDESAKLDAVSETAKLKTFTDITFSLDQFEGFDAALYFSTELGKAYKKNKLTLIFYPKLILYFTVKPQV